MPPYVLGICTLALLRPRGIVERWLVEQQWVAYGDIPFNALFGLGGSSCILALCLSPYVYLPVSAVLRQGSHHLREIAQLSGAHWFHRLRHVTLPLLAPAVGGGMLLVMLYALADFGVPSLLRLPTFSTAIYGRFTGQVDRAGAALLSLPLIIATLGLLVLEERLVGRGGAQINRSWRPVIQQTLGRWQIVAQLCLAAVTSCALVAPIGTLLYWSSSVPSPAERASQIPFANLISTGTYNIVFVALIATITTMLAVAPALLLRRGGVFGGIVARLSQAGYALPGVVVALSIILVTNQGIPWMIGGLLPLSFAYIIRFLPQAMQSLDAAFEQIAPTLEEVGRSLGHSALQVLRYVVLPLATPGLRASWALLFLGMLKELPATLLLRPAGFDTLAVRIWMPASDGLYTAAATPALLLIACACLPVAFVLRNHQTRK
jgi:iron(III) transport system permease protein